MNSYCVVRLSAIVVDVCISIIFALCLSSGIITDHQQQGPPEKLSGSDFVYVIFLSHRGRMTCLSNKPPLLQMMACRLFGTKPLTEPMLTYRLLHCQEQWNLNKKSTIFIQENWFENVCKMAATLSRSRWLEPSVWPKLNVKWQINFLITCQAILIVRGYFLQNYLLLCLILAHFQVSWLNFSKTKTSYDHHGGSNHRQMDCLFI